MGTNPVIETRDLTKVYEMGDQTIQALRGISLTIHGGEMVAITGPSGSGKSTLMAILGALDMPTSGTYALGGTEISAMDENQLAAIRNWRIGFVFQKFNLLPRATALDNVALPLVYSGVGARKRRETAKAALGMLELGNRLTHRPTELSGGRQQRVAIARARVNATSVMRADEPTGNLDSKTGEDILALFEKLHEERGITVIIVTHAPEVAA